MAVIELKTPAEISMVREAGRVAAAALAAVRDHAAPGVRLEDLDTVARDVIAAAGARPSFLGYHPDWAQQPYPRVTCISVNDAIVHGIPTTERLADGDLVSVDCAVHLAGWCGDAAVSFIVGEHADPEPDTALIETTRLALQAGIDAARPGNRLGDVSHAIAVVARAAGYGLMADHGGHGVGRAMHEAPFVPNEGRPGRGLRLVPGLVVALEPMLIASGRDHYRLDADGWTLRTADGSRAAHVEDTIAVTDDGPQVLTSL